MKKLSLFILLAAVIGLSSCQSLRIEKRHYNNGWYVDFGSDKKQDGSTAKPDKEELPVVETESDAATDNKVSAVASVYLHNANSEQVLPGSGSSIVTIVPEKTIEPTTRSSATDNNPVPAIKEKAQDNAPASDDADLILLVILAILIPPLAVYMKQGVTAWFWITLICWLLGGTFLFGHFGYGYLGGLGLLAIILALLIVFDKL